MASENNTDTFSNHIMRAIAETRNNKKRPDKRPITEFIQENYSTNVDFNFIEEAIEKLIKNEKIVNKPIIQSMTSHFSISNDQQIKMKLLKANQYLQTLALHLPIMSWKIQIMSQKAVLQAWHRLIQRNPTPSN